ARGRATRREPPRLALLALDGAQPRRAKRREGVVGDLACPREIPQRDVNLLRRLLERGDDVGPEARRAGEQLANRVMDLPLSGLGWRPGAPPARAEVQRDAPAALAERPRADPDDLAACAQLVDPRRAVCAEAAREHVSLPHLRRQRDALEWDERLAEPVD